MTFGTTLVLTTFFRTSSCPCVCVIYGKGDAHVDAELEGKNKRVVMSLIEKMEVLDEFGRGMSIAVIRHHYGGCE